MSVTVINEMLDKIFVSVEKNNEGTELVFRHGWINTFTFFHVYDCCESVWIEDVEGDLSDLEDSPLLEAEVVSNKDETDTNVSRTWTFFKFGTAKGHVVVRWCGESNGYYSESVSLRITSRIDF
ncbi:MULTISPECIES: DUF7448 domain-containing protein [Klebsiella]|uniref:DUF7448 domain-containing protein n=1 Tax=Klebsiella pasteurii TaxID=2587529 RepID=A0ABT5CLU9_9ENTR|nr:MULTISPECIES: hypothetical protein [Klebsiella]AUV93391.1 hypothetical protein C2U44_21240 [Klebsiella oxytoca]EKW3449009.1 hypothetical protein [Klebsiella pneumoniae]KLU44794.1 hypothetical protein ABE84_21085 [Klebsiella michiganensis]KLU52446.1 hypothetical protein ABE97_00645 [Klebsiella michiganensis]MDC0692462.1 hypothetical protein [Klebsiella pasteurii]